MAAVEILYLARAAEWGAKGRATLALPILDLPVSRTGVVLYYPPLFRVNAEPGAFRTQPYEKASSDALNGQIAGTAAPSAPMPALDPAQKEAQKETQALVDRYRARSGPGRSAEAAPVRVLFPSVGPSLFLVSELTSESKGPVIELSYQKVKDGGAQ